MKTILILNGPNLNMLGIREPEIYGSDTLADIESACIALGKTLGAQVECRQSNHEGELVTWIQKAHGHIDGLIINAGAYTHTSIAILDALRLLDVPIVEVHLSDPKTRETFRHHSYIELTAARTFAGKGAQSYIDALEFLASAHA